MSGRLSRLQPSAGLSKSSALSHVYVQYPSLRCTIPGPRGLFYDDGNKLLICPTVDQVIDLALCTCTQSETGALKRILIIFLVFLYRSSRGKQFLLILLSLIPLMQLLKGPFYLFDIP